MEFSVYLWQGAVELLWSEYYIELGKGGVMGSRVIGRRVMEWSVDGIRMTKWSLEYTGAPGKGSEPL